MFRDLLSNLTGLKDLNFQSSKLLYSDEAVSCLNVYFIPRKYFFLSNKNNLPVKMWTWNLSAVIPSLKNNYISSWQNEGRYRLRWTLKQWKLFWITVTGEKLSNKLNSEIKWCQKMCQFENK